MDTVVLMLKVVQITIRVLINERNRPLTTEM